MRGTVSMKLLCLIVDISNDNILVIIILPKNPSRYSTFKLLVMWIPDWHDLAKSLVWDNNQVMHIHSSKAEFY